MNGSLLSAFCIPYHPPVFSTGLASIKKVNRPAFLVISRVCPVSMTEGTIHATLKVRNRLIKAVGFILGLWLGGECLLGVTDGLGIPEVNSLLSSQLGG